MVFLKIIPDIENARKKIFLGNKHIATFKSYKLLSSKYAELKSENKNYKELLSYCDITKCLKATGDIRKTQISCLNILKRVIKLANSNNLSYWADFGTLIGAIRHKGFIPWDNDIDICMLKTDLMCLIPLLEKEFDKSQFIVRQCSLYSSHMQVRICNAKNDVGIDIFPVDVFAPEMVKKYNDSELNNIVKNGTKQLIKEFDLKKDINQKRTLVNRIYGSIFNGFTPPTTRTSCVKCFIVLTILIWKTTIC